jgi:hypothetical protein
MSAEAGIQSFGDNNNFKDLDYRFRGNEGVSLITTQSSREGRVLEVFKGQKGKGWEEGSDSSIKSANGLT